MQRPGGQSEDRGSRRELCEERAQTTKHTTKETYDDVLGMHQAIASKIDFKEK